MAEVSEIGSHRRFQKDIVHFQTSPGLRRKSRTETNFTVFTFPLSVM